MKVKDFIEDIKKETPWVNYSFTRDQILCGDENTEISKIGVCWVATKKALQQAKENGINFIISHENFLYVEGTCVYDGYLKSKKEKIAFCKENGITVYRLHDGWDQFPEYGIADCLSKAIGLPFDRRDVKSFNQICHINGELTMREIAQKVANALDKYGCNHVEILGAADKKVNNLVMGVGAATIVPTMHLMGADAMIIADDGSNNWIEQQWCLDNDIPVIIFHHSSNEMAGIDGMKDYLNKTYPDISVLRLSEGYYYTLIEAKED